MVSLSEFTLVGKEDPLGEALPVLAAVQLPLGSAPEIRIVEPAQQEDGLLDFSQCRSTPWPAGRRRSHWPGAARWHREPHDGSATTLSRASGYPTVPGSSPPGRCPQRAVRGRRNAGSCST